MALADSVTSVRTPDETARATPDEEGAQLALQPQVTGEIAWRMRGSLASLAAGYVTFAGNFPSLPCAESRPSAAPRLPPDRVAPGAGDEEEEEEERES